MSPTLQSPVIKLGERLRCETYLVSGAYSLSLSLSLRRTLFRGSCAARDSHSFVNQEGFSGPSIGRARWRLSLSLSFSLPLEGVDGFSNPARNSRGCQPRNGSEGFESNPVSGESRLGIRRETGQEEEPDASPKIRGKWRDVRRKDTVEYEDRCNEDLEEQLPLSSGRVAEPNGDIYPWNKAIGFRGTAFLHPFFSCVSLPPNEFRD